MKVLIAEDDEMLVRFLQRAVERWGHQAVWAVDGKQAWNLFQEHADIGLVISDWMMPEMDGVELVRRIRACRRPDYIYIILLTAKSRTEDIVQGMQAGADDFLIKPFDQDELRVRLRAGERVVELERMLIRRNAELEAANLRMRRDLEAAALVQQSLLPAAVPAPAEARFAWAFKPCDEMSGDSLGIIPLDDRHIALYVLDVSGHGVAAALLSVSVSHFLTPLSSSSSLLRRPLPGSSAWDNVPPAQVAAELNRRFPVDPETVRFFTLLYGILDLDLLEFRYVCAGHPPPIHLPAGGEPVVLSVSVGRPIGLEETAAYQDQALALREGDRLLLYSDGIWEAMNGDRKPFGPQQLLAALGEDRSLPLQTGLNQLLKRVAGWCGTDRLKDDASLLAVEVPGREIHP